MTTKTEYIFDNNQYTAFYVIKFSLTYKTVFLIFPFMGSNALLKKSVKQKRKL